MRVKFRQGVIRPYYSQLTPGDPSIPSYLQKTGSSVSIRASIEDPIIVNFCHYGRNYLYEETEDKEAWTGFIGNSPYWLYWDLTDDGTVSYGYTRTKPLNGLHLPDDPADDQHFFVLSNRVLKVWNKSRRLWETKVRVFSTRYDTNSDPKITEDFYENRSQVGLNKEDDAGYLLFGGDARALRDSKGFLTTIEPLMAQGSFFNRTKVSTDRVSGDAIQNIPRHHCVAWRGPQRKMGVASPFDTKNPAVGVSIEGASRYQFRQFVTEGYIRDLSRFQWSEPPNTYLFVGEQGQLTTTPPTKISIQRVGYIVDRHTIYVSIQPQILIDPYIPSTPDD